MFGIVFIAIFMAAPQLGASEAAMSQWIYEDQRGQKCVTAGVEEIDQLQNCYGQKSKVQTKNLDQTAEYLIFQSIAENEMNKLSCNEVQAQLILNDPGFQEKALNETCAHIPMLEKIWDNEEFLMDKISSYEKINDRSIRPIPVKESQARTELINKMKASLNLYQKLELSLRGTDLLLRSPQIYDFINKQNGKQKNPVGQTCTLLERNAGTFLKEDLKEIKKNKAFLSESFSSGKWAADGALKKALWKSSSQGEIFRTLNRDAQLKKSTLCRLEGRYGQGAQTLDALTNIAWLGLGFVMGPLAELRAGDALASNAGKWAQWTGKAGSAALIGSDVYLSVGQTMEACGDKVTALSSPGSCDNLDPHAIKRMFYERLEGGHCVLASTMALVSGGFGGLSFKKLSTGGKEALSGLRSEVATDTELAARIDETESWMKNSIKEAATTHLARYTQVDPSNEQIYLWHLRETGLVDAADNMQKEILKSLRESKIEKGDYIGQGISGAQLVTLSEGRQAVWKPFHAMGANGNHELAALIIDQKLKRNRVPLVVEREYMGEQGTLHLFVKDKDNKELLSRPPHTVLFDSLMTNRDRHGGNYFTVGERPVDIDHGLLFSRRPGNHFVDPVKALIADYRRQKLAVENLEKQVKLIPKNYSEKAQSLTKVLAEQKKIQKELYLKSTYQISIQISDNQAYEILKKTSEVEWKNLLQERLSNRELSVFFENRKEIINTVEDARKTFGDEIFSAGPFSPVIRGLNRSSQ